MSQRMENVTATIYYLLQGVPWPDGVHVARWFVEQGSPLRAHDPLVTLQCGVKGPAITLCVPRGEHLEGAVVERILCAEGRQVSESDCLAVLRASGVEVARALGALEDLGDLAQYPVAYVDSVIGFSSTLRWLDRQFPGVARWYFRTYPLVPLLKMAGFLAVLALGALFTHQQLDALAALQGPAGGSGTPWWDSGWLLLVPFSLGALVWITLIILGYLSRWKPLRSSAGQRTGRRGGDAGNTSG